MKLLISYFYFGLAVFIVTAATFNPTKSYASSEICQQFLKKSEVINSSYFHEPLKFLLTDWRKLVGQRLNEAIITHAQISGRKYSLIGLAREIPVDNSSITKYINGSHSIPFNHAQRISEILSIKLEWLLAQDLLVSFDVNGIKVQPNHFQGLNARALKDAFTALVWSVPQKQTESAMMVSDIDPTRFCIEDCKTEELVDELNRRGWHISLSR